MKKMLFAYLGASTILASSLSVNAQEGNIVFEGKGISSANGDIYIGMSRNEVIEVSQSNACERKTVCSFNLPPTDEQNAQPPGPRPPITGPFVQVIFSDEMVSNIEVFSNGDFTTTAGANFDLQPFEVADLYEAAGYNVERSSRSIGRRVTYIITVDEAGYTMESTQLCFRTQCSFTGSHIIYDPIP